MRLFIAINFEESTKKKITAIQARLREYSSKGRFTHLENLHLTLVFIGELEDASAVIQSMNTIPTESFKLTLNGIGNFNRDRGDIWWIGIEKCKALSTLHARLTSELIQNGVPFDRKGFSPHITLAREVTMNNQFDRDLFSRNTPAIEINVTAISLMKSERLGGKLTYTELHTSNL